MAEGRARGDPLLPGTAFSFAEVIEEECRVVNRPVPPRSMFERDPHPGADNRNVTLCCANCTDQQPP